MALSEYHLEDIPDNSMIRNTFTAFHQFLQELRQMEPLSVSIMNLLLEMCDDVIIHPEIAGTSLRQSTETIESHSPGYFAKMLAKFKKLYPEEARRMVLLLNRQPLHASLEGIITDPKTF